jgi:hypothetical protein
LGPDGEKQSKKRVIEKKKRNIKNVRPVKGFVGRNHRGCGRAHWAAWSDHDRSTASIGMPSYPAGNLASTQIVVVHTGLISLLLLTFSSASAECVLTRWEAFPANHAGYKAGLNTAK